jgi:hypothetical protein
MTSLLPSVRLPLALVVFVQSVRLAVPVFLPLGQPLPKASGPRREGDSA